jgi:hypothetical protein
MVGLSLMAGLVHGLDTTLLALIALILAFAVTGLIVNTQTATSVLKSLEDCLIEEGIVKNN